MKQLLILTCLVGGSFYSYSQQDTVKAPAEIPFAGTYKGKAPCEECTIIEKELELNYGTDTSGDFSLREKFVSKGGTDIMSRQKGEWIAVQEEAEHKIRTYIILNNDLPDKIMYFLRKNDGSLLPLNEEKRKLEAEIDMTLKKVN